MSAEETRTIGTMYGNEGLTIAEYNAMVKMFLDLYGQMAANGFIEGYHQALKGD